MLDVADLFGPTDGIPLDSLPTIPSLTPVGRGLNSAAFRHGLGVDSLTTALDLASTTAMEVVEGHFLTAKVSHIDQAGYFKDTGFMKRSQADPLAAVPGSNPTPFIRKLEAAAVHVRMTGEGLFGECVPLSPFACLSVFSFSRCHTDILTISFVHCHGFI